MHLISSKVQDYPDLQEGVGSVTHHYLWVILSPEALPSARAAKIFVSAGTVIL
jgi:hypothetical protein